MKKIIGAALIFVPIGLLIWNIPKEFVIAVVAGAVIALVILLYIWLLGWCFE